MIYVESFQQPKQPWKSRCTSVVCYNGALCVISMHQLLWRRSRGGVNTAPPSPCLYGVGGHHFSITVSVLRLPRPLEKMNQKNVFDVHDDAPWKALEMKTRSPEKFTDVSDVMVLMRMVFCPTA